MSPTMYVTYRDEGRTFQDIGIWGAGGRTLTGLGDPDRCAPVFSSYGVLQALGVQPMRGRWFTQSRRVVRRSGAGHPVVQFLAAEVRRPGVGAGSEPHDRRPSRRKSSASMPKGFKFLTVTPEPDVFSVLRLDRARLTSGSFGPRESRASSPASPRGRASRRRSHLPIWLDSCPSFKG